MQNKLDTVINLFEGREIRSIWNSEKEDYYFSVVDVIHVVDKGKIVSSGTHKNLLKTSKIYKNLYETESLNS